MRQRTLVLAKTFFGRFFESDLMPPGLPQVQLIIWSMAFLAMPGLMLPMRLAAKYIELHERGISLIHPMQADRLVFITLTMTAMGIVALVTWDGVFPDRRDARILTGLPLPGWVPIAARLLALAALAAVLMGGLNVVPTATYAPTMAVYGGASNVVRGILAHFLATALAGLFVLTTLIMLQGIALNVGGKRAADRISVVLQVLFVVALLQLIFFMRHVTAALPIDLRASWLYGVPSIWFLGLYDVIGGRPAAGAGDLARMAIIASSISAVGAAGLFIGTHARLTRLALETRELPRRLSRVRPIRTLANAALHPNTIAVFDFTSRTVVRSRSHRLLLSIYVGAALALIASAIVPLAIRAGVSAFAAPEVEILSAPLVLAFAILVGMRVAIAIPVEPRANWVIRLREPAEREAVVDGIALAMLACGVLPSTLLAALTAAFLWGWWPAFVHAVVCALMGWLLAEILLIGIAKIPFTCTYFPGKSRIQTLWPLYLNGFIAYTFGTAALEIRMINNSSGLVTFASVVATAIAIMVFRRRRRARSLDGFLFQEEDPTAMFEGFHLSEGLAAASDRGTQAVK